MPAFFPARLALGFRRRGPAHARDIAAGTDRRDRARAASWTSPARPCSSRSSRVWRRDARGVDLRGLAFMDSSGLRAIAIAAQRAQERGRRFALVPGAAEVMRVFDITRMRERLEFVSDPGEVATGP